MEDSWSWLGWWVLPFWSPCCQCCYCRYFIHSRTTATSVFSSFFLLGFEIHFGFLSKKGKEFQDQDLNTDSSQQLRFILVDTV
jgi:hypothetical protein